MGPGVLEGRIVGRVEERLRQVQAPVNLRLWDGQVIRAPQPAPVTLTVKSPQALTQLASPSLGKLAKSYVEGEIDTTARFADPPLAGRTRLLIAGRGCPGMRAPVAGVLTAAAGVAVVAQDRVRFGAGAACSRAHHEAGAMAEAEAEHEHQCCEHDPRGPAPSWFDRVVRHPTGSRAVGSD